MHKPKDFMLVLCAVFVSDASFRHRSWTNSLIRCKDLWLTAVIPHEQTGIYINKGKCRLIWRSVALTGPKTYRGTKPSVESAARPRVIGRWQRSGSHDRGRRHNEPSSSSLVLRTSWQSGAAAKGTRLSKPPGPRQPWVKCCHGAFEQDAKSELLQQV